MMARLPHELDLSFEPGSIFCNDMHGHALNGAIADTFVIDETSRYEIYDCVGQSLYQSLTASYLELVSTYGSATQKRAAALSGKTAYIVSFTTDFDHEDRIRSVLILYNYDDAWWLARAMRRDVDNIAAPAQ